VGARGGPVARLRRAAGDRRHRAAHVRRAERPHGTAERGRRAGAAALPQGQLHLHSANSGDSNTPPADVVRWYEERGYDFIVFTDHNYVATAPGRGSLLVFPGVELTQNLARCDPPPDRYGCLLHVNALFVDPPAGDPFERFLPGPTSRVELYARGVKRALALGGLAQLNHPNYRWAADADIVTATAAAGATLVEIHNQAHDSENDGDATHPSTEALWDAALSRGARIYGTATDDAHHYDDAAEVEAQGGERPFVGDLGWVMVRAEKNGAAIEAAIARGDFYASTGVLLDEVELAPSRIVLTLAPTSEGDARFDVIGEGGAVIHTVTGRRLAWSPSAPSRYWRVRVSAGERRAFTQPIFSP
jgi:hypothetical protein